MRMRWSFSITCVILAMASIHPASGMESIYSTQGDWEVTIDQASWGYDPDELASLSDFIAEGNTKSVVVTVGDALLYSYGDSSDISYVASVRKSVMAILYGPYVKDGTIKLESTLEEIGFDDLQGLLPVEKKATIRDLISARSGIYHPASNEGDSSEFAPARGSQKPGTYYLYNNWDFNAAGAVLEQLTGRNVYDIYEEVLAKPLRFQDFKRNRHRKTGDASRSNHLAYHFHISARDLARIGYLMLRDGDWMGRQLIDADWIREIRSVITPLGDINPESTRERDFAYGYMWWVYAGDDARLAGAYTGMGYYGQYIMVIPRLDMVISHKTNPSFGDRRKYASGENVGEISVSLERFLEIVRRIVDSRLN